MGIFHPTAIPRHNESGGTKSKPGRGETLAGWLSTLDLARWKSIGLDDAPFRLHCDRPYLPHVEKWLHPNSQEGSVRIGTVRYGTRSQLLTSLAPHRSSPTTQCLVLKRAPVVPQGCDDITLEMPDGGQQRERRMKRTMSTRPL